MKVFHLISGGDVGGAKTHVLTLIREMNLNPQNDVRVLCVMEGPFTKDARNLGVPVFVFKQSRRYDLASIKKMADFIQSERAQLIHCHGARANFIGLFLRFMVKCPLVTTIHSDYLLDFIGSKYKQRIYMPLNLFALRRFKYFITVTDVFKQMLIDRRFNSKYIFTVYNGINTANTPRITPKETFLSQFGLRYEENRVYIGVAARLHPVKGVDVFLKAVHLLKNEPDLVFLIAGAGDYKAKYEAYISENGLKNVHMLSHVSDIYSFYNCLDINTLSSHTESFPYSLLEGGVMKKATISTAVGGIVEMLVHGESGLLVPDNDYVALADAMLRLSRDEALRVKLGEAFYHTIVNNFSTKKMAADHESIYASIIKKG